MKNNLLYHITEYPNTDNFDDNIFRIENITLGDYNTISSRNYNRITNYFKNNDIIAFNRKKYKMSSHIPMIHDTLSYYILHKNMNSTFNNPKNSSIDTMDLMLIRQLIDKKQRCDSLLYNPNKYGTHMMLSKRFEL